MIMFWVAAALLSAGVASFIVLRASRAATAAATAGGEDPALSVFRRQLSEIDDLSDRGLIPADERRSARAEAARRLLAAADRPAIEGLSPAAGRRLAVAAAVAAPLIGLGLYLATGSPQQPDLPFAKRAAAWRAADPASLDPAQMAVVLEQIAREHPRDPEPLYYLARAQLALGDPFTAERGLRRAVALAPRRADLWAALGEVLAAETPDQPSADARTAFGRALALDPAAPGPRYALARDKIAAGDAAGGLTIWRALLAELPAEDPRRAGLADQIAEVERTGALPAPPAQAAPAAGAGDQAAFIRSMVERLAARLAASPDDPAGWARLIRSYGVLGDAPRKAAALARARQLFKDRPDALRAVAEAAQGAAP
jgi:cytochrome c-type biogenesis protein CcmH